MEKMNNSIFNVANNKTRSKMLDLISKKDMNISELARELNISISATAKHASILKEADLIFIKVYGKTHVLSINEKNVLEQNLDNIFNNDDLLEFFGTLDLTELIKKQGE